MAGEGKRKLIHFLALIMPAGVLRFGGSAMLVVLIPVAIAAVLADWLRFRSSSFNRVISSIFGSMLRDGELPGEGRLVILNGATVSILSMTLLLAVFPTPLAVLAFSLALTGDAFAAIIGRAVGRHPWGRPGCTLEGSVAYTLTAGVTAFLLAGGAYFSFSPYSVPFVPLVLGSVVAAAVEVAPLPGNDNFNSPFAAAGLMLILYNGLYSTAFSLFPLIP